MSHGHKSVSSLIWRSRQWQRIKRQIWGEGQRLLFKELQGGSVGEEQLFPSFTRNSWRKQNRNYTHFFGWRAFWTAAISGLYWILPSEQGHSQISIHSVLFVCFCFPASFFPLPQMAYVGWALHFQASLTCMMEEDCFGPLSPGWSAGVRLSVGFHPLLI